MKKSLLVCGAGTMGSGIAQIAAQHNLQVVLLDASAAALERAQSTIHKQLQTLVHKQKITAAAAACIQENITYSTNAGEHQAAIILEAIAENLTAKQALLAQLADINGPEAVYATNTSSLSVSALAEQFPYPHQLAGLHFFNPATLMKLVELVTTAHTSETTIQTLQHLATAMGKTAVVCKDAPGFIVNRVARPYYIEALRLAEQGVSLELIDTLMEAAGFKLGPFKLMDLIGNDINYAVSCSVYEQLGKPARLKPSHLQEQLVQQANLGKKSGKGFYAYSS